MTAIFILNTECGVFGLDEVKGVDTGDIFRAGDALREVQQEFPGMKPEDVSSDPLPIELRQLFIAMGRASLRSYRRGQLEAAFWTSVRALHPTGMARDNAVILANWYYACFDDPK